VGEPSHLEVITAHKGLMVFELTVGFEPQRFEQRPRTARRAVFEGRAAHSSTPALGRNAIRTALATLVANPQLAVASIAGGDAVNRVPARCEVVAAGDFASPMAGIGASLAADTEGVANVPRDYIPAQAIAILARFVAALQEFADHAGAPEAGYAAPTLTCNPGVIRSAEASIALEFELRPPPALALDAVRAGVAEIVARLVPGAPGLKLALVERRANPGFRSTFEGETVELAMAALARAGLGL
jgi:acetylornithine deacetylase/succinyl-diaminopimelate desuccinylase-like protein